MAKKNELPALVISLLITAALLGAGAWWLKNNVFGSGSLPTSGLGSTSNGNGNGPSSKNSGRLEVATADGSSGRSIFLPTPVSASKQKGLEAMAAGDYAGAQAAFAAAIKENRNDPESLIYSNNAEIGEATAYTIAVSVPVGSASNQGNEILRGAAQAQQAINQAGGINGTPLKVLLFDDGDEPQTASAIATALADDPDVLGVVGHFSSGTTLAAAEVYEAQGLPMISPTSTAVKVADAGKYIFRTVPSDRLAAATLSRYVLNTLNRTKAAVFYTSESVYSSSVRSEFTTELLSNGGQVVADIDISEASFSAGQAMQTAKAAGADVLMLALTDQTVNTSLQILALNQQALPVVGGDSLYDFKILDVGRNNALGLTVAVPWHILSHEQTPFVQESRSLWGGDVNWRTATAYDAVVALAAGISESPTREGIEAALTNPSLSLEGATDPIRFLPSGDRNQPSQLVTVKVGDRSGTGYDFVPVP